MALTVFHHIENANCVCIGRDRGGGAMLLLLLLREDCVRLR